MGTLSHNCNFMRDYKKIYIALRDASSGSADGQKIFQMNIGTTRKGRSTQFNLWYEDIVKSGVETIHFFRWPVLFHEQLDLSKPLPEQCKQLNIEPIVQWHDIQDLENKRKEDLNTFKEEYMGELVDSEEQLYDYSIVEASVNNDLVIGEPVKGMIYSMGIDPAATNHFFAISIFEKESKIQRFLYYKKGVPLATMEKFCCNLIEKWRPWRVVIDGNGLGYQLSQTLKNKYFNIIKVIRGVAAVKTPTKITGNIPMKEFLHTNQLKLMNYNEIQLIPDEMQIRHYLMWQNNYECVEDVNYGHGDIVIANGFALLPDKWKYTGSGEVLVNRIKEVIESPKDLKEEDIAW
jgi:hypothetical protein